MRPVRVCVPLITVYLLYILGLTALSNVGFPKDMQSGLRFPYLADKPVGEDGYYMLTVAWNIASGRGIVYNYGIPTTGIQPLSTAIYALLAWVVQLFGGDQWLFIRSVLAFGSITLLVFGHVVGTIARHLTNPDVKDLGYLLGFIGVVFNFALFRWFTYGLETGIYLILFALCVLYSFRLPQASSMGIREAVLLGTLGGAAAWARIDFGVVLLVFLAFSVLRHQFKPLWATVTLAVTALMVSPWFLYNHAVTNSWIPSSGSAQATLITVQSAPSRLWTMGKALLGHLTPWVYSSTGGVFLVVAFMSLIVLAVFLFRARTVSELVLSRLRQQPHLAAWLLGVATLTLVYVALFWAGHFYPRYSAPIVVPVTAIMAAAVAERTRALPKTVQAALLCTLPVCFFGWAFLSLHTGRIGNSHTVSAGFIQENFSSAKVGAFQSGVVGYFNSNVINLDGKVNHTALEYTKDGQLHTYLDSEEIDVLVDWPEYIYYSLDADWLASNWITCEDQIGNDASICLRRRALPSK